jgi:hypothetical protein
LFLKCGENLVRLEGLGEVGVRADQPPLDAVEDTARAERITSLVSARAGLALSNRMISYPSILGSPRSTRMRSGMRAPEVLSQPSACKPSSKHLTW